MRAGGLRKRVTFQRESSTPDGMGGDDGVTWPNIFDPVWGELRPERGAERVQAGRLADPVMEVLTVRSSSDTRGVTAADRAVIDGVAYQIRAITNPDQRNRWLEMSVERGVAV